jgi:hypothetical protein
MHGPHFLLHDRLFLNVLPFVARFGLYSFFRVAEKARFLLENVTTYLRKQNEEHGRYSFGAPEYVPRGYKYERLPISGADKSQQELDNEREQHEAVLEQTDALYAFAVTRFPTSTMNLLRAQYYFVYHSAPARDVAFQALSQAESLDPPFAERFTIYLLHKVLRFSCAMLCYSTLFLLARLAITGMTLSFYPTCAVFVCAYPCFTGA